MAKKVIHNFGLSETEVRLICFIREFGYGELNLFVQDGSAMMNNIRAVNRVQQDPIFKKIFDSEISSLI